MAIAVTTIGTAIDNVGSGATLAITVPGGGVPSGALIVVAAGEGLLASYSTGGSMTDTAGNTYTQITHTNIPVGDFAEVFYAKNVTALSSGNSITFTKQTSGDEAVLSAFYATGIDTSGPLDTAVTATATGTSSTPSVTSGTPAIAGELFVACLISQSNTQTYTQDSGNGWAAPFDTNGFDGTNLGSNVVWVAGGNQVNSGTGTKTFAPTMSILARWAAIVVGFKAAASNTGISGIAWSERFEEFKGRAAFTTAPAFGIPPVPAVGVQGVSWSERFEPHLGRPIRFGVPPAFGIPPVPAVGLQGVAWAQRFEEFKGKPKFTDVPAYGIPPVPAVGLSGVAWSQRFEPFYGKPIRFDIPQAFGIPPVPAVGNGGVAWSQRLDYVTPRKGRTEPPAYAVPSLEAVSLIKGIGWFNPPEVWRPLRPFSFTVSIGATFGPIWVATPPVEFTGERRPLYRRGVSYWKGRA